MSSSSRALGVVGLCACFMLLVSTSASSNDELFINTIYKGPGQARATTQPAPHGIPIERTTFKLKEASFCPYDDDISYFGYYGVWTSKLSCPASTYHKGFDNIPGVPLSIVGRCHIQTSDDVYYDLELPTPDPNVAIFTTFTATCHLKGDEECGPDCDFVGTVVGNVYEVYNSYTTDGNDPSCDDCLPPTQCDAYDNKRRMRNNSTKAAKPHGNKHSNSPRKNRSGQPSGQEAQAPNKKSATQAAAAYYHDDDEQTNTPLPEYVYMGEALVYTGYMSVATLNGDVLPALGGWFEYWTAYSESYWDRTRSADLPSTARAIEPYTYTFQLWKPVSDYGYQRQ